MKRRFFLSFLSSFAFFPKLSIARASGRPFHVALITASTFMLTLHDFLQALAEKGRDEGRDIVFQYGYGNDDPVQLDKIVADAVSRKVDIIVAWGTLAPLAAKRSTNTIPIVLAGVGDAVKSDIVTNLARPNGNITGYSFVPPAMTEKRLQLISGVRSNIKQIAIIWNRENPHSADVFSETRDVAKQRGIVIQSVAVSNRQELENAFKQIDEQKSQALILVGDPLTNSLLDIIAKHLTERKIPSLGEFREFAAAGGLMSYGPDLTDSAQWTATYVDRILKGARPIDLPIQQPTVFNLIINSKTARSIDLELPFDLLARADEIIE